MVNLFKSPVVVFVLTWLVVTLSSWYLVMDEKNALPHLSVSYYIFLLLVTVFWVGGCFVGTVLASGRIPVMHSASLSRAAAMNVVCCICVVYLFFKCFDVYLITGSMDLSPDNIALYRTYLTEQAVAPNFQFINIFNGVFFLLPSLAYLKIKNKIKYVFFSSFVLLVFFLAFVYLSTARSSIFASFIILFFIMAYSNVPAKYLVMFPFVLFVSFGVIGELVGKPGFEKFFLYLALPSHAFDIILDNPTIINHELLSFRPFQPLLNKVGVIDSTFHLLDYVYTPLPTNVYTVFGVYVNDFGYLLGASVFFIFAVFTSFICKAARKTGSIRLQTYASLLLSLIVLGAFYDYYTSSMYVFIMPFIIFLLLPPGRVENV